MATSNSFDYSVTAAQIIQAALEDLEIIANGESVDSSDQTLCLQRLNFIVKQWQGRADMKQGLKVWSRKRITLFLEKGQQSYEIGPASGNARATLQAGFTTLSAAEAAGQTVISITSNTDTTTYPGTTVTMTDNDIVGIVQDDGTMHWSTINGTPSSTMTIDDALASAASSGNRVYWFTSRANAFPEIEGAYLRDDERNDTPLLVFKTVQDYELGVVDKYSDGQPTAILVEPQLTTTRITLDSQPDDVNEQIILVALYRAEDYDSTANDIAYPQEYYAALEWELAFRVAPAFHVPWTQTMEGNRIQAIAIAAQVSPENSTAFFMPGRD